MPDTYPPRSAADMKTTPTAANGEGREKEPTAMSLASSPARVQIVTRPSRSGGPEHRVAIDTERCRPLACVCQAGQRGIVCWAALSVMGDECYGLALAAVDAATNRADLLARQERLYRVAEWARRADAVLAREQRQGRAA